jgi:hypothetical protein
LYPLILYSLNSVFAMKPCDLQFVCDQNWDDLEPIAASSARYCCNCCKAVFQIRTPTELLVSSTLGRCVGIADDNDFVGVIGEPTGSNQLDWMAAGFAKEVTLKLVRRPTEPRLVILRLLFPRLFDRGANENILLSGGALNLGALGAPERTQLIGELRQLAPEVETSEI